LAVGRYVFYSQSEAVRNNCSTTAKILSKITMAEQRAPRPVLTHRTLMLVSFVTEISNQHASLAQ
jgi:hypothetical protein